MPFAFLSPWFFALLPALAVGLYFVYKKAGEGERKVIPTLFLLKKITLRPTTNQKRAFPLRLLFELFCFALLLTVLATPHRESDRLPYAIILDNSFAHFAKNGSATFFEQGVDIAIQEIEQSPSGTQFTIFTTAPTFTMVRATQSAEEVVDKSTAKSILYAQKPAYAESSLGYDIATTCRDPRYARVAIISMKNIQGAPSARCVIHRLQSPPSPANIAITAATFSEQSEDTVSVTVRSFAAERTVIELGIFDEKKQLRAQKRVVLQAQEDKTISVPLSTNSARRGSYFTAEILTKDPLIQDNTFFFTRASSSMSYQQTPDTIDLGLSKIKKISRITENQPIDFEIIYQQPLNELPEHSALIILPTELFPVLSEERGMITRKIESSPLTTYVDFSTLTFPKLVHYAMPAPFTPFLFSSAGAVGWSLESKGNRYVVLGFDIFPYEGKKTVTTSVLTMNIIHYLTAQSEIGLYSTPGKPSSDLQLPFPATITTVGNRSLVTSPGFVTSAQGKIKAVNIIAPNDSNLLTSPPVELSLSATEEEPFENSSGATDSPVVLPLLLFITTLLCCDLFFYLRRRYAF